MTNVLLIKSNVPLVTIQMLYSQGDRERVRVRKRVGKEGRMRDTDPCRQFFFKLYRQLCYYVVNSVTTKLTMSSTLLTLFTEFSFGISKYCLVVISLPSFPYNGICGIFSGDLCNLVVFPTLSQHCYQSVHSVTCKLLNVNL